MSEFWPQNLKDWLAVLGSVALMASGIGAVVRYVTKNYIDRELETVRDKYKEVGDRLMQANQAAHNASGKAEMVSTQLQQYKEEQMERYHKIERTIDRGIGEIKLELEKIRKQM